MCGTQFAENAGCKKSPFYHHRTTLLGCIFAAKACINNRKKNLLSTDTSSTYPHNMVNFGLLTAEICWRVWGTPVNFNWFHILAVLLHGTLVVDVSQTLQRWTEGATYIRQGGHHVGHWPTFYFYQIFSSNVNMYTCETSRNDDELAVNIEIFIKVRKNDSALT